MYVVWQCIDGMWLAGWKSCFFFFSFPFLLSASCLPVLFVRMMSAFFFFFVCVFPSALLSRGLRLQLEDLHSMAFLEEKLWASSKGDGWMATRHTFLSELNIC